MITPESWVFLWLLWRNISLCNHVQPRKKQYLSLLCRCQQSQAWPLKWKSVKLFNRHTELAPAVSPSVSLSFLCLVFRQRENLKAFLTEMCLNLVPESSFTPITTVHHLYFLLSMWLWEGGGGLKKVKKQLVSKLSFRVVGIWSQACCFFSLPVCMFRFSQPNFLLALSS